MAWVARADVRAAERMALALTLEPANALLREGAATPPTKGVRHAATCMAEMWIR